LTVIIPLPTHIELDERQFFLNPDAKIVVENGSVEVFWIGSSLAAKLRLVTGFALPVQTGTQPAAGDIFLKLGADDPSLGEEGYELLSTPETVTLRAAGAAGLFYATQTLRQMFPAEIESLSEKPNRAWAIPCGVVRDLPRYSWRGMMLDVGRHFFPVSTVKRLIDLLAYHKINTLHLHLSDDQGWRIMIESWPCLALHGGSTATNGDPGGFYTQDDYRDIVAYARQRFITVVPEIDMPGHTNAALASYAQLNENGVAPSPYTGIKVGFSSLAVHKEITYQFVDDVVREIAALTPGAYFHIGGDETLSTSEEDYIYFIERVQKIVRKHGKRMIGWEEIGKTSLTSDSIVQHWWNKDVTAKAAAQGAKIIASPASRTYMDIKYHEHTTIGQNWTGAFVEVRDAYEWEPVEALENVAEESILGVEAALWTETIFTQGNLDFMVFPRLCGYAEIGWSPREGRDWESYRQRLVEHGKRLTYMGVQFYRSEQVDWD
jgi:hexosaminidase